MLGSKRRRIQTETLPTIAPNRAEHRSDGILCPMVKLIGVAVCLLAFVGGTCHGQSQAPASSTLVLSLKTMSKALGVCRVAYEQHQSGSNTPMVKAVIGASDYQKDMTGLGNAEKLVGIMIAHPDRITGQTLVATLSTSDDFYAGVGSTRLAILGKLIATKGDLRRRLLLWMPCANSSLPTPDGPQIRTEVSYLASFSAVLMHSATTLFP